MSVEVVESIEGINGEGKNKIKKRNESKLRLFYKHNKF